MSRASSSGRVVRVVSVSTTSPPLPHWWRSTTWPSPSVTAPTPDKIAAATGADTNDEPHYRQFTGFVLAPDGTVVTAVYSHGAIGRLVADDVAGLVRYITSQKA